MVRGQRFGFHAGGVGLRIPAAGPQALAAEARRVTLSLPGNNTLTCLGSIKVRKKTRHCHPRATLFISDAILLACPAVARGGYRLR